MSISARFKRTVGSGSTICAGAAKVVSNFGGNTSRSDLKIIRAPDGDRFRAGQDAKSVV